MKFGEQLNYVNFEYKQVKNIKNQTWNNDEKSRDEKCHIIAFCCTVYMNFVWEIA